MVFYCYIVTNKQNGTLYVGHTDCLTTRIGQHKDKTFDGFTGKYGCDQLVWFRTFDTRDEAFRCERRMKEWRRSWKVLTVEEENPNWRDLYWEACGVLAPGQVEAFLATLRTLVEGQSPTAGVHADGSRHSPG